ncbi:MAG: 30S ribosomal protein S12 methylthiotransferase RimO [Desulfovibrionaceae bacterium]
MINAYIISLGCPKNTVDTEQLLASFGNGLSTVSSVTEADVVIINTCSFIAPAIDESIESIVEVVRDIEDISTASKRPLLVVIGCLVGRFGEKDLAKGLPEVDLWLSNKAISEWPMRIKSLLNFKEDSLQNRRLVSTRSYAWLKISDGCSHSCSFCTIPSIRGSYRSTSSNLLLEEAKELLSKGVKELIVVAQDSTRWGSDFGMNQDLSSLLRELDTLKDLQWLRLMYLYPAGVTEKLLKTLQTLRSFVPYFDIPLQHAHRDILELMGRPFAHNPWIIMDRVRSFFPKAALRTSFIVGFPGEEDKHFEELLSFVKQGFFAHIGVFTYHPEQGTVAATLPNQVPEKIKKERRSVLMETQSKISREYLKQYLETDMDILVDKIHEEWDDLYVGRTWFQAPDFDGVTYISGDTFTAKNQAIGAIHRGHIIESELYDLVAVT